MKVYNNRKIGTFHFLSTPPPPPLQRWQESKPSIYCRYPLKNEIQRVDFLSVPLKKSPKAPNYYSVGLLKEKIRTLLCKNMPSLRRVWLKNGIWDPLQVLKGLHHLTNLGLIIVNSYTARFLPMEKSYFRLHLSQVRTLRKNF